MIDDWEIFFGNFFGGTPCYKADLEMVMFGSTVNLSIFPVAQIRQRENDIKHQSIAAGGT